MTRQMKTIAEHFPISGSFTISRGSKTTASVVTCQVSDGGIFWHRRMRALWALR